MSSNRDFYGVTRGVTRATRGDPGNGYYHLADRHVQMESPHQARSSDRSENLVFVRKWLAKMRH